MSGIIVFNFDRVKKISFPDKMRIRLLTFITVVFVVAACQTKDGRHNADHFTLSGQLDNAVQLEMQLQELTTSDLIPVDSFRTDTMGRFHYRGRIEEAGYYVLRTGQSNYITLVVEPGEEVHISGDAGDLAATARLEGSPGSLLLARLNRYLMNNYQKVDSLAAVFRENQYSNDFTEIRSRIDSAYIEVYSEQQEYVKKFIRKNPASLASIIALYQYFGNQLILNEDEHFEYFELLSRSLSEVYPTNRHVLDLNRRVSRHRRNEARRQLAQENLAVGSEAPEIVLPDPGGEMVALSSLRGKYVFLDFWASWCAPCREANKKLADIYSEYNDRGFEIYAVSLDRNREQWLQGIEEDKIDWIQVSDLRFWSSPVVSLYDIERLPFTVLIGPDGRIIQKNIDPEELEDKLKELIGDYQSFSTL